MSIESELRELQQAGCSVEEMAQLVQRTPEEVDAILGTLCTNSPAQPKQHQTVLGEPRLGKEQRAVVAAIESKKNVFFTGSAGVGKSFLLNHILKTLDPKTTFVTATTGLAATNIGGTTIHSFAGIGFGQGSPKSLRQSYRRRNRKRGGDGRT